MVKRGEIYWAEMPGTGSEQTGRQPALIIQNDAGNRSSTTTIIAALTTQPRRRQYPFHVHFTADESGLARDGTVLCEQIRTISQSDLLSLAGALSDEKMLEVDLALHRSLGLKD